MSIGDLLDDEDLAVINSEEFSIFLGKCNEAEDLCRKHAGNKRGVEGTIVCPKCGNNLHYTIAENGHCNGNCETEDCLTWFE